MGQFLMIFWVAKKLVPEAITTIMLNFGAYLASGDVVARDRPVVDAHRKHRPRW